MTGLDATCGLCGRPPDEVREVAAAARVWWATHRPLGWSLEQHLDQPTVNTATRGEADLARAVAAMLSGRAA